MAESKNLQSNFSIEEFDKLLPHSMKFNTAKLVNGNELYWVTEKPFTAEDLEAFQETMANKTSVKKAYVTFKDISSLDFQKDLDNQALVTMRKYDFYNLLPFVQALATNDLDISRFAKPSDKVDGLYIFGDAEGFVLRATAFYNGEQIAQCKFSHDYDYVDDSIRPQIKLGSGKWEDRPAEYFMSEFEKETENFAVKKLGAQLKDPSRIISRKLNEEELKNILELHQKWLNKEPNGKKADLTFTDLRGANLRGADLREADMQVTNLSNADLSYANLQGADLQGSTLIGANLCETNLRNVNLQFSDLSAATFDHTLFNRAYTLCTVFTKGQNVPHLTVEQKDMAIFDDNFKIIGIENENIYINDDYTNFDVYISFNDSSLHYLLLRSNLYEQSGYDDTTFRQMLDSSAIVNTYLVADSSDVSLHLILDDSENGENRYFEATFRLQPQEGEFALTQAEHDEICAQLEKSLGMTPAEALQKWAAEENDDPDYYEQQQLAEKEAQEQFKEMNDTLYHMVQDFFSGEDSFCTSIDRSDWRIASGGYDRVAEIYHNEVPVCGVFADGDNYQIEDYRAEQGSDKIVKAVQSAMIECFQNSQSVPSVTIYNADVGEEAEIEEDEMEM